MAARQKVLVHTMGGLGNQMFQYAAGKALASALLKLHEDNASTLTPDPVYARFYYSHPPAVERLAALVPRAAS
mgnify:CR=1 FL=1